MTPSQGVDYADATEHAEYLVGLYREQEACNCDGDRHDLNLARAYLAQQAELTALRSRVEKVVGEMRADAKKLHTLGEHSSAWGLEARADALEGEK